MKHLHCDGLVCVHTTVVTYEVLGVTSTEIIADILVNQKHYKKNALVLLSSDIPLRYTNASQI